MNIPEEVAIDAESSVLLPPPSLQRHSILTEVGQQQIVFPSQWVAEILLVKRSQILTLPCYSSMLLGVMHHQGDRVPLISSSVLISQASRPLIRSAFMETMFAIRLNQAAENLAGVAIVVDRVIGNIAAAQASELSASQWEFQLQDIPDQIWQPWQ